jgi:hypothetical protein
MLPDLVDVHRLTAAHPYQRDLTAVDARLAGLTSALLTDLGEAGKGRHWLTVLGAVPAQRRTSMVQRRTDDLAGSLTPYSGLTEVRQFNEFRAGWQ